MELPQGQTGTIGTSTQVSQEQDELTQRLARLRQVWWCLSRSPATIMKLLRLVEYIAEAVYIFFCISSFPRILWNVYKQLIFETPECGERNVYFW